MASRSLRNFKRAVYVGALIVALIATTAVHDTNKSVGLAVLTFVSTFAASVYLLILFGSFVVPSVRLDYAERRMNAMSATRRTTNDPLGFDLRRGEVMLYVAPLIHETSGQEVHGMLAATSHRVAWRGGPLTAPDVRADWELALTVRGAVDDPSRPGAFDLIITAYDGTEGRETFRSIDGAPANIAHAHEVAGAINFALTKLIDGTGYEEFQ